MQLYRILNNPKAPQIDVVIKKGDKLNFDNSLVLVWTDNFDSKQETEFWYCIKDNPLDINLLKSKLRLRLSQNIGL